MKRDKTRAFKASGDTIEKIDEIIKKSGKGPIEFFEDLVMELSISKILDPNDESVSPDLGRHFESDVQKLKNATNSTVSIFVSQMENVLVEKNQWQKILESRVNEKQEVIDKISAEHVALQQKYDESSRGLIEMRRINESTQIEVGVL